MPFGNERDPEAGPSQRRQSHVSFDVDDVDPMHPASAAISSPRRTSHVSFEREGVDPLSSSSTQSTPPSAHPPQFPQPARHAEAGSHGSRRRSEPNAGIRHWTAPFWSRESENRSARSSHSGHAPSSTGSSPRGSHSSGGTDHSNKSRQQSQAHSIESANHPLSPLREESEEDIMPKMESSSSSNTASTPERKHSIVWMMNPFRDHHENSNFERNNSHSGSHHSGEASRKTSYSGRRNTVMVGEVMRRGSAIIRKGSTVAAEALHNVDMLREVGNPLDMQINETRRISTVVFNTPEPFHGRKSIASSVPLSIPVTQRSLDDPVEYEIKRLANHDDVELMANWKKIAYRSSPFWAVISMILYWAYFALRVKFTRAAEIDAGKTYGMAWAFIAVETGVAIPMMLHRTWSLMVVRGRRRPKLRVVGEEVPSVDVFITCCKEDDELVFDTVKAACNVDYPSDRFRVIVLDDGASEGLKNLIENYTEVDNVYYRSRPKYPGVPHHFKAGNLNYGLAEAKLFPGGAANFVAALDADMIPEKDWLRALIPHMLQDLKCSMACPPQLFYNIPKDDPLCQSLDTFVHISEPIKDALGVAWCTGSGYIMRRDALDSIGWFPYGSLAEDVCTSTMLLGSGWRTAFIHEPLQFGTVPESLTGHLKQRTRWTIGTVQTSLKLRFCIYGPYVKQMSFMQKFSGFVYTISSLFTIFLVMSIFTVPIVLVSGGNLIPYTTINQLRWLVRFCFFQMISNRINEGILYLPSGYLTGQRDARGMIWMAPYHAIAIIQSFILPKWLGGKIAVFTSSGSQKSELNERDARLRAPLVQRLKVTLWDCRAGMHLFYILFVIAAVTVSTYWCFTDDANHNARDYLEYMLTHAAWPPLIWLMAVVSCWSPIQYALMPPTMPDREELLDRDAKTGVAYPKVKARKISQTRWHILHEIQYSLISVYCTVLFVLSFWL